jgi:hypothetical protein
MSLLDGILGQLSGNATIDNLAAKVGLTPDQVEQAVHALAKAHAAPGDTINTAADVADDLAELVLRKAGPVGGGILGSFGKML